MKNTKKQSHVKQITYALIIMLMLCNFILPNYSYAVDTEEGGSLLEPIAKFLCFIPDTVNEFLQNMFISSDDIDEDGEYKIIYSSGTIFSGTIPAFDINFIDPMPTKEVTTTETYYSAFLTDIETGDIGNVFENLKENRVETQTYHPILHFPSSLDKQYEKIYDKYNYYEKEYRGTISPSAINYDEWFEDTGINSVLSEVLGNQSIDNSFWICGNTLYFMIFYTVDYLAYYDVAHTVFSVELTDAELQAFKDAAYTTTTNTTTEYWESSSAILQPTIATWYNALRRIALVGLLSVLVYIGIRIVLSSSSAKDNAKYKKMLKDWLVALCLLFTLHYIMSITTTVVDELSQVINSSLVSTDGADVLMSSVRNTIANSEDWPTAIMYVIIYCVLTVYTVIFTVQYFRRTIYMAFLTMIAPLITLTYPLDKMKDNRAQAFDMWLKDYIFFALLQLLHLVLYYIFVGSAIDLASKGSWLYAIVALGFLTKAEKIMKQMFGFGKSKSMGALAAGATGALVMNAINKLPHGATGGHGKGTDGGGTSGKAVRTKSGDPLKALKGTTEGSGDEDASDIATPGAGASDTASPDGGTKDGGSSGGSTPKTGSPGGKKGSRPKRTLTGPKMNVGAGIGAVASRYWRPVTKGIAKGFTGGTGAIIGFSAGVAQGDIGSALGGAWAGGKAGAGLVDWATTKIPGIGRTFEEIEDTFNEGAYGMEKAQNIKFDREFRRSPEYKELKKNPNFTDANIQKMLNAGISDPKKMAKILKKNAKDPKRYSIDKAIAYSAMAEKCPDGILYNNSKFIRYCRDKEIIIAPENVAEMRKNIAEFK